MTTVILDRSDDVAYVRLHRPDAFNAIDPQLADELRGALLACWHDATVRAVVITGSGRAFCGGGDLRAISMAGAESVGAVFYDVAGTFHESILAIRRMPKPVIAAINGPAAGGGFSLALACDYRVIADHTFMQLAYTSHGLSIDGGGTFTLPRLVGLAQAMRIALHDERMPASECLALGLVHEVVPTESLDTVAAQLARRFADMPVEGIGRVKRLFNRTFDSSLEAQLEAERAELALAGDHAEGREGISAFLEKRRPQYT